MSGPETRTVTGEHRHSLAGVSELARWLPFYLRFEMFGACGGVGLFNGFRLFRAFFSLEVWALEFVWVSGVRNWVKAYSPYMGFFYKKDRYCRA